MDSKVVETLKSCCKNDAAFNELKNLFQSISREAQTYKLWLDLLERTVHNDHDSILVTELNLEEPGPEIVYVNDGFTRITGYTREEVIGKSPRILQGPKTDRDVLKKLKKRLSEGKSFYGHTVNYRKDGTEFVNQWDIHPLKDQQGHITHWVSFQHDVTERKRSERMLLDVGVDFDNLKEESRSILADIDESGEIRTANKAFRSLSGYDAGQLEGMNIMDLVSGKNSSVFEGLFTGSLPEEVSNRIGDIKLKTRSGAEIEVVAKPRILKSENDGIIRLMFENRDLQKKIAKVLRSRESGFKRVFNKKSDFQYRVERSETEGFKFSSVSGTCFAITGLSPEELNGKEIGSFVHPEDLEKVKKHYSRAFEGRSNTEVYRFKTADGPWRILLDYARPVIGEDGSVKEVAGSVSREVSSEKST